MKKPHPQPLSKEKGVELRIKPQMAQIDTETSVSSEKSEVVNYKSFKKL